MIFAMKIREALGEMANPPSRIGALTVLTGRPRADEARALARLCAALGCRPADLLDYEPDPADLNGLDEND